MARVWIYQANRLLTDAEVQFIDDKLAIFLADWNAHGAALAATAEVRHNLFIILSVDESQTLPSGCSIDKSVYFFKSLEEELNIALFDRFQVAYRDEQGAVQVRNRAGFEALIQSGVVTADTIVFNNLVTSSEELASRWEVPFHGSWHKQVFA